MRSIKVVKVSKPSTPFMVAVPASVTGTKRVKRYFGDREKALAYVIQLKQQGFMGVEGQGSQASGGVTLGEAAALWLARHEQKRMTFFQLRQVLNPLIARHGKDPINAVDHKKLDTWLRSLSATLSPTTIHNYWRVTRRFFNFCRDYLEVITRNPMAKLQERRLEHQEPAILTPKQMRACLEVAKKNGIPGENTDTDTIRLVAYLALGGFAGLRTEEILHQQWEDIDWVGGEIYVRQPKRVGGWRPRHVDILPALRRHLEPVALKDGKILPGGQRTLYLLRRAMMDKLNWESWPNNCLRHSFQSYHYAAFGSNEKTAKQLGHQGGVSFYIYGSPVVKTNAVAWWEL